MKRASTFEFKIPYVKEESFSAGQRGTGDLVDTVNTGK